MTLTLVPNGKVNNGMKLNEEVDQLYFLHLEEFHLISEK